MASLAGLPSTPPSPSRGEPAEVLTALHSSQPASRRPTPYTCSLASDIDHRNFLALGPKGQRSNMPAVYDMLAEAFPSSMLQVRKAHASPAHGGQVAFHVHAGMLMCMQL